MNREMAGHRGLYIRPTNNIRTEIKYFADEAERIRALGNSASVRQHARRQRILTAMLENCQELARRNRRG